MGNSIRTTLNTQNTPTPATFKAGDPVLCPSIGNSSYTLYSNGSHKDGTRLIIRINDDSHSFYRDGRISPNYTLPSLFHDTETNRQAIALLYSGKSTSQSKVINATADDDDEVVLISAMTLSDTACDLNAAAKIFLDIAQLLHLIQSIKVGTEQAKALTRITCDTTDRWADMLNSQVVVLNEPLSRTKFGTLEVDV
ncbi:MULTISPECIES: hypothetical protein [unclassified Psychrobacter]|uniref:hypothetical protein n=1 Tax=unclassified Psychrobacter TaxID=196806 RepID=UPI0025E30A8E|nr:MULTISPECIES: hypothetical protein [unclassified Psychrobacter]